MRLSLFFCRAAMKVKVASAENTLAHNVTKRVCPHTAQATTFANAHRTPSRLDVVYVKTETGNPAPPKSHDYGWRRHPLPNKEIDSSFATASTSYLNHLFMFLQFNQFVCLHRFILYKSSTDGANRLIQMDSTETLRSLSCTKMVQVRTTAKPMISQSPLSFTSAV